MFSCLSFKERVKECMELDGQGGEEDLEGDGEGNCDQNIIEIFNKSKYEL